MADDCAAPTSRSGDVHSGCIHEGNVNVYLRYKTDHWYSIRMNLTSTVLKACSLCFASLSKVDKVKCICKVLFTDRSHMALYIKYKTIS